MQTVLYPVSVVVVAEILVSSIMLLSMLEVFEAGLAAGAEQYVTHPLTLAAASLLTISIVATALVRYLFKRFITLGS